tara:strand:+ start:92 stop:1201 length:1110 start_codon:yes stop_codon:yes gene_type:complete
MKSKEIKPILNKIRLSINKIAKYEPGESENESKNGIKLSSNESPFLVPQKVKNKILLKINELNLYPDGDSLILKKAISDKYKISDNQIICGNGSDDILSLIGLAFSRENCEIICNKYGFLYYPIIAHAVGAKVVFSNKNSLIIDENDIINKVTKKTNIVFLANPNNPTGLIMEKKRLIRMLEKIPPYVIVVLDGAYAEYVEEKNFSDGTELIKKFPNVIVTRTFSKIYALAGLRLGWAFSSKKIISILEKIRGPFNVNAIAQIAGATMLKEENFLKKSIKYNQKWKSWLVNEIKLLGFETQHSFANFILVKCNFKNFTAESLVKSLKKRKIFIRHMQNYGLGNYFRISIGKSNELKKLISSLKEILKNE